MRAFFVQVCPGGVCKGRWRKAMGQEAIQVARQFGGVAVRRVGEQNEIRVLIRAADGKQVVPFYAPLSAPWPTDLVSPGALVFA